jgi:hypothetical protein
MIGRASKREWNVGVVVGVLLALSVLAILLMGCGDDKTSDTDKRDDGPASILHMPEDFPNVAHKCDGEGHRVYVSNNGSAGVGNVAVVEDPTCGGLAP